MKLYNVTVVTMTMNLGRPNNKAMALRGLVLLHVPLQQRFSGRGLLENLPFPVFRWIPLIMCVCVCFFFFFKL
jgi:hypothetical protein